MPDANGKFKGSGWSRNAEAAHARLELDRARREWLHANAGRPLPPELAATQQPWHAQEIERLAKDATRPDRFDADGKLDVFRLSGCDATCEYTGTPCCRVPSEPSPEVPAPPDCNWCGEDGHTAAGCPTW